MLPHTLRGTVGYAIAFSFILATFSSVTYQSPASDLNSKLTSASGNLVNSSNPLDFVINSGTVAVSFSQVLVGYASVFFSVLVGGFGGLPAIFAVVGLLLIANLLIAVAYFLRGVFDV